MSKTKAKQKKVTNSDDEEVVVELPERYHSEGCPMESDDLEWSEKVAKAGKHAGHKIEIIRCCRCGGQIERRTD